MTLVESREWVGPAADWRVDRPEARLYPTGAVLFATLDLRRPLLVQPVTWAMAADRSTSGTSHGGTSVRARAARCASWLLGR